MNDNESVIIRPTKLSDLDTVMAVYEVARKSMREAGNLYQWIDTHADNNQ